MSDFTKQTEKNKITFKNLLDGKSLTVTHNDDDYIYDCLFIDKSYSIDFLEFIIRELKKTKDIGTLFTLYDSKDLRELLESHNIRVSNYQYTIKQITEENREDFEISATLDDESKDYYLNKINEAAKINHEYYNPTSKFQEYTDVWFKNSEFQYRVYRKDGKIMGIVEFMIFDEKSEEDNSEYKIFSVNNKLCIRCLFGETQDIMESILKDLLTTCQKDAIINFTYTDELLKRAVIKLDGEFDYCQYTLVED